MKTQALLEALARAARRRVRRRPARRGTSRAKERVYSFRDAYGQWDPKNQRPELWNLFNGRINKGESIRVFPISNWTEIDVRLYIHIEQIPVVPMYFAAEREMVVREEQLIPVGEATRLNPGEKPQKVMCRFRTLGCYPCTGAVHSTAKTVPEIIDELQSARHSERITRLIDHDMDASMEQKKREGTSDMDRSTASLGERRD